MATTNDLKNGLVLNIDGQLWTVVEFQHVKPGKGPAFVRTKLKAVLSGKVVDKTFNAGVKVETANVDKRDMQYLYRDGDDCVFMDTRLLRPDPRDPTPSSATTPSGCSRARPRSSRRTTASPLYVELPASVELMITYTEPGLQGDRSTGGTKPATLETGAEIAVPLFIENNTKVKVDTRDGSLPRPRQLVVSARGKARKRALDVLYEADLRGISAVEVLDAKADDVEPAGEPVHERARRTAWSSTRDRIDDLLSTYSEGWTLERMPAVDRNLLRIGTYELLWGDDVPDAVAISEAVTLAKSLSTDESPTFVNGLLGRGSSRSSRELAPRLAPRRLLGLASVAAARATRYGALARVGGPWPRAPSRLLRDACPALSARSA